MKETKGINKMVGGKIAGFRLMRNMTIIDLAKRLGFKEREMMMIESGVTSPKLEDLQAIAKALNVSLMDLIIDDPSSNEWLDKYKDLDIRYQSLLVKLELLIKTYSIR